MRKRENKVVKKWVGPEVGRDRGKERVTNRNNLSVKNIERRERMKRGSFYYQQISDISLALIMVLVAAQPARAVDPPTAELNAGFLSQYIWRGQAFGRDSLVIQPELTVSWYGFTFDMWSNFDTNKYDVGTDDNTGSKLTETDLTFSYGSNFGPLYAELGTIYYALDGAKDSQELYLSLGVDCLLSPTFTVYREFLHYPGWYLKFDISHSFTITDYMNLDLGASIAYEISEDSSLYPDVNSDGVVNPNDEYSGFMDGTVSASLPITFAKYFTITPLVALSYGVGGDAESLLKYLNNSVIARDQSTFVYGGVNFTFAF